MKKEQAHVRFKKWFDNTGYTHDEAGKVIGVTRFAVWAWKTKYAAPTYPNALKIERVVGIPAEAWFN